MKVVFFLGNRVDFIKVRSFWQEECHKLFTQKEQGKNWDGRIGGIFLWQRRFRGLNPSNMFVGDCLHPRSLVVEQQHHTPPWVAPLTLPLTRPSVTSPGIPCPRRVCAHKWMCEWTSTLETRQCRGGEVSDPPVESTSWVNQGGGPDTQVNFLVNTSQPPPFYMQNGKFTRQLTWGGGVGIRPDPPAVGVPR